MANQWKNFDIDVANTPIFIATQYEMSGGPTQNNANLIFANSTPNNVFTGVTVGVFGVDANKMQVSARTAQLNGANNGVPQHAGWVVRTLGSGGRAGRVMYETMVAMGSIQPTANSSNVQLPEFLMQIVTQPQSNTWNRGNGVNLFVVANTYPAGSGNSALTYYWQQDGGNASQTWANVVNAGTFASANGVTTSTLSIANNFLVNANNFRVVVSTIGANNITSANAQVIWS